MLIKFENPLLLSRVIDILSELVTDVRIKITEFGVSITAMDPANVSLVGFKLPKSAFTQFESDGKGEVLGVNLDNLKQILKRCSSVSTLILEKKENSNTLDLIIQDKIKRNFSLTLIEIESEEKEIPNLEFSSKIELNSSDLVASIEDCLVVSDACSFIVKNGKFIIEAKSLNSAKSEFSGDEAKIEAEDCRARYSLEYLIKFMKGAKLVERTVLKFGTDHPLRIDIKNDKLELIFILAPRIENED